MKRSFTLMEVLIATLILALVGVGALSLITQSVSLIKESQDVLNATLLGENIATRDLLGLLPRWKIEGEQGIFKWKREIFPTQLPRIKLCKYTISWEGRKIEFVLVKEQ
ncbi:MAG: prepilin-type N-terminal cleavage/methylation domain-containing protein [Synergistetes bacterium]|nr:prepilin-type N-terminal cleavage/methylation domain-containing protein [Synergistota bacterium]